MTDGIPKPTTPFIPRNSPPASKMGLVQALSVFRVLFGAGLLVAPTLAAQAFQIPLPKAGLHVFRSFGVRDLVLGELLWITARGPESESKLKEVRRVLWAYVAIDAADTLIPFWEYMLGNLSGDATLLAAGGAAVFTAIGASCLHLTRSGRAIEQ